jgi:hypothetical protein
MTAVRASAGKNPGKGKPKYERGHVGKGSKTGKAECSQAMSAWKTSGSTPEIQATLGKCRSAVHAKKQAGLHEAAGNDARAQVLRHRAENLNSGKKSRLDQARTLKAKRAERHAAKAKEKQPTREAGPRAGKMRIDESMRNPELDTFREQNPGAKLAEIPIAGPLREKVQGHMDQWERLHPEDMAKVESILKADALPPPIVRFYDAKTVGIPDGFHRIAAHIKAGRTSIKGYVLGDTPTPASASKPAAPPDLPTFAANVQAAVRSAPAHHRFGDNKVYISKAHEAYVKAHGDMPLDAFKARLVEAVRARHIDLSRADLVEAMPRVYVKQSQTDNGGAQYHFVRAGDLPGTAPRKFAKGRGTQQRKEKADELSVRRMMAAREAVKNAGRKPRRQLGGA